MQPISYDFCVPGDRIYRNGERVGTVTEASNQHFVMETTGKKKALHYYSRADAITKGLMVDYCEDHCKLLNPVVSA